MQTVLEVFDRMQREYRPEMLGGIDAVIQFDIHGPAGGSGTRPSAGAA